MIPTISILVALIGTFGFMAVAGFSINLLTLFALVLAIGTVVDNAIVVVEAVQAKFDIGYKSSYMAANDAMKGITSAIITSTLVFMVQPKSTPAAATPITMLYRALLEPSAEPRKFTASLLTPTNKLKLARSIRKTIVHVRNVSMIDGYAAPENGVTA